MHKNDKTKKDKTKKENNLCYCELLERVDP